MSVNELNKWRAFLHAAAQVKPGDPDYADARKAVERAQRKIAFLNRQANQRDIETPSARETAQMSAVASVGGDVASLPASALGSLPEVGPLFQGPLGDLLTSISRRAGGRLALTAKGADLAAYERGQEAHPTAAAVGEMAGPVVTALAGGLARKPIGREVVRRLKLPAETPAAGPPPVRGLLAIGDDIGAVAPVRPPTPPVPALSAATVAGLRRLLANPRTSQALKDAIRLELARRAAGQ